MPDQLLVHVAPVDLLVIRDWQAVKRITCYSPMNKDKYCLEPLPGFDIEEFPFIVSSGRESISLINVKEGEEKNEKLIDSPVWTDGP